MIIKNIKNILFMERNTYHLLMIFFQIIKKKTNFKITLFLFYIIISSLKFSFSQYPDSIKKNSSNLSELATDIWQVSPFILKRNNKIILPSLLTNKTFIRCRIVTSIFIGESSELIGFNLSRIRLYYQDSVNLIYFRHTNELLNYSNYPDNIKHYYDIIEPYVKSIDIKKKEGVKADSINNERFGFILYNEKYYNKDIPYPHYNDSTIKSKTNKNE